MLNNYEGTLKYLFSALPMYQRQGESAYKNNLYNTLYIDNYLNNPHKKFKSVHIAGTNGKGSVAHMLASILQEAGYKVGLYTSPHLKDFRERIRINGQIIEKAYVVDFVQRLKPVIEEISPSFFEITVAMAFNYFSDRKIDIAVVEVGMGGRLDSTNIITPLVSVITNIGLDHVQFLGNTVEKIAMEKAGIIKRKIPVVIGERQKETEDVFETAANENQAALYYAEDYYRVDKMKSGDLQFSAYDVYYNCYLRYPGLITGLSGNYQQKNIRSVLMAADILNDSVFNVEEQHVYNGIKNVAENTGMLGRWQVLSVKPKVICDTGHNREGLSLVIKQLFEEEFDTLHIVFGTVNDKNLDEILKLLPENAVYYFTKADIPRALDENILMKEASGHGLKGDVFPSVKEAFEAARQRAKPEDLIFVGGSTFVVAEVL